MNSFLKSKFCGAITYLIGIQITALLFLFIYRLIFLAVGFENTIYVENKWFTIFYSFYLSLRFDNIVLSHILIIPLLILPILALFNLFNKKILIFFNIYFILIYSVIFLVSCVDIPYYQYFSRHINASIFNWVEYGSETAGMVFAEKSYYLYFILYICSILLFSFLVIRISRRVYPLFTHKVRKRYYIPAILILFTGYGICYLGTKGRIRSKSDFDVQHAYFSNSSFINQMAITPFFYLYKSMGYNKPNIEKELMEPDKALEIAGKYMEIDLKNGNYIKNRANNEIESPNSPNIIIILVESFSNDYLDIKVNDKPLMPYINDLINNSTYYFDNFYSQGTHTNQGIVSSLYGFPSLFERHMMKSLDISNFGRVINLEDAHQDKNSYPAPIYNGLPLNLKNIGYKTMFFNTHIATYDNGKNLFLNNGINNLFSQENYPPSEWVNVWGVNDEFLFNYALSAIDSCSASGKPFFAGLMTISNHPPYYYSEQFKNISKNEDERAMAYTDYCIQKFMEGASKKEWYNNTIFLFSGDHGKILGVSRYDMPLSLNHVPLVIYSPIFRHTPRRIHDPAGQIDIYPTVMGLLGHEPSYNSFGTDILNKKREYIYFTSDEKLGCIGNEFLYVYNVVSEQQFLYDTNTQNNVIQNKAAIADSMRVYSFSMIEAAKYILKNELGRSE